MFVLPFQVSETEYSLFICLQDDNIERLRAYDPAEVNIAKVEASRHAVGRLKDVVVGYATDEELKQISEMLQAGTSLRDVLRLLTRGFAFRTDAGDREGPYLSFGPGKGKPS